MFNSILIICTGNICRSPIAERILRQKLPSKKIDSAGLSALVDHPADPSAISVAIKYGVPLENHAGKQFNSKLARHYDLILVMEKEHLDSISAMAPEARGKTMLLGHWDSKREIPDPYKKSSEAFEYVFKLIELSCMSWLKRLDI